MFSKVAKPVGGRTDSVARMGPAAPEPSPRGDRRPQGAGERWRGRGRAVRGPHEELPKSITSRPGLRRGWPRPAAGRHYLGQKAATVY